MTQRRPYPVKKGGEKEQGRRREGGGPEREAGSGNSARAPNAPVPGLQGAQRAPPGPRPPDALPDTTLLGAWTTAHHDCCTEHYSYRAGHYNEHYFPAPDIAPGSLPPTLDAISPLLCPGPDSKPPAGSCTSCTSTLDIASFWPPSFLSSHLISTQFGSEHHQFLRFPAARAKLPAPPFPGCLPGCLSPGDCGGFCAAVEASLFCTGTTGTASLAGTGTKTRTTRPLS